MYTTGVQLQYSVLSGGNSGESGFHCCVMTLVVVFFPVPLGHVVGHVRHVFSQLLCPFGRSFCLPGDKAVVANRGVSAAKGQ